MEKKKRRILIGVPCMDMVSAMFTQSLAMLQRPKDCDVAIMLNIGSLVYDSRNQIAKAAIKMEADLETTPMIMIFVAMVSSRQIVM